MDDHKRASRTSEARDRLIAAARQLFTGKGESNVGINDVTAAAGVARMTLYNNFASKDALVSAVYEEMAEADMAALGRLETAGRSEEDRIFAVFDHFDRSETDIDYRGCPFIHASLQSPQAEGPVYAIVQAYKRALREHVARLLDEGRADRDEIADQIVLLLDGAVTEAYLGGVADPLPTAKRAVSKLLHAVR